MVQVRKATQEDIDNYWRRRSGSYAGERRVRRATQEDIDNYWRRQSGYDTGQQPEAQLIPQSSVSQAPQTEVSPWQAFQRQFRSGLTQNWEDEARGLVSAATGGSYDETVEKLRAEEHQAEEQQPLASFLGNITGGLTSAAAASKLAKGAPKWAQLPLFLLGAMPAGAATMKRLVASGGVQGAISGAGKGEGGLFEKAQSALFGGAGSAVGTAGLGYATSLGGTALKSLWPKSPAQKIASYIPPVSAEYITKNFKDIAQTAKDTKLGMLLHSKDDLLPHLFYESQTNLVIHKELEKVLNEAVEFGAQKTYELFDLPFYKGIPEEIRETFFRNSEETIASLKTQLDTVGQQYDDVLRNAVIPDTEAAKQIKQKIIDLIKTPAGQDAFGEVLSTYENLLSPLRRTISPAYKKEKFIPSEITSYLLHSMVMQFNKNVDNLMHNKDLTGESIRAIMEVSRKFKDLVDDLMPEYKQTRGLYEQLSKQIDAISLGKRNMYQYPTMTKSQEIQTLKDFGITKELLPYYKHGVASALHDAVGGRSVDVDMLVKNMNSNVMKERIQWLFGKEAYVDAKNVLETQVMVKKLRESLPEYKVEVKQEPPKNMLSLGYVDHYRRIIWDAMNKDFREAEAQQQAKYFKKVIDEARKTVDEDSPLLKALRRKGAGIAVTPIIEKGFPSVVSRAFPLLTHKRPDNDRQY